MIFRNVQHFRHEHLRILEIGIWPHFELPFNGQLSRENRWVVMASLISWEKYEDVYASLPVR